jgi:hypothetical protein
MEEDHHRGRHHTQSWFATLTYAKEPLTVGDLGDPVGTLDKQYFRRWIHNTARDLGQFRYYAVGEYGEKFGRPHYHLALFPEDMEQAISICKNWKKGFTRLDPINHARARYLANYTTKKLTKPHDYRLQRGQEPEFRISSSKPPIGSGYIHLLAEHYRTRRGRQLLEERGDIERTIRFGGKRYPIAPYILNAVRQELGIPTLHSARAAVHPTYAENFYVEMPDPDENKAKNQEEYIRGIQNSKLHRNIHPRV